MPRLLSSSIRSTQIENASSRLGPGRIVSDSKPGYPISWCSCIRVRPSDSGATGPIAANVRARWQAR
jgi:hypothetical protein